MRADKTGAQRAAFERNKKKILKTQNTCGICGGQVEMKYKAPHPMSAVIDHIIPVSKGGHPSDIDNLQLAHWQCNRVKSDKLYVGEGQQKNKVIGNRNLPQTLDWSSYRCMGG